MTQITSDPSAASQSGRPDRVLLVDDTRIMLQVLHHTLEGQDLELLVAHDGNEALRLARETQPALVLLDIIMPGIDGFETCRRLKADPTTRDCTVILMSALDDTADKVRGLELGAVDYITKPFQAEEVIARVQTHLRLRRLERDLARRNDELREINENLLSLVEQRSGELVRSRDAVIFGMAKLAESRDGDTGLHLERICRYVEILAGELAKDDPAIDKNWVRTVNVTAALHDVGKVGVPDAVLLKQGRLTEEERREIQRHTTIGGDTLLAIKQRWGDNTFLLTATEIAFSHHEKWDGSGYPFGLSGEDIPLAARVVAVADVYDALTSPRVYKASLPHEEARRIIVEGAGTHFDPRVVDVFISTEGEFRSVAEAQKD